MNIGQRRILQIINLEDFLDSIVKFPLAFMWLICYTAFRRMMSKLFVELKVLFRIRKQFLESRRVIS